MIVKLQFFKYLYVLLGVLAVFFIPSLRASEQENECDKILVGDSVIPILPDFQDQYNLMEMCSICHENLNYDSELFLIRCAHWFHKSCIEEWISVKSRMTCPICRSGASSSKADESNLCFEKIKMRVPELSELIKLLKYSVINTHEFDFIWLMNEIQLKQPDFDFNNLFENGDSLFTIAVKISNTFLVEHYLKKLGTNVIDQLSENQLDNLFFSAIKSEHIDFMMYIFDQTNVLDRVFEKLFHLAVEYNQIEIVKLFIVKSADINKKDESTRLNAVQIAVYKNNVDMFNVLVETGKADLTVVDDGGRTLLQSSIRMGCYDIVRILLDLETPENLKVVVNKFDGDGCTPLLLACVNRRLHIAKMLIAAGADLDIQCPHTFSPIEYVIQYSSSEQLFYLFLHEIENDISKLQIALTYAQEKGEQYFSKELQKAIEKNI